MKKLKEILKPLTKWIIGIAAFCIILFLAGANLGSVTDGIKWFMGLFTPLIIGFFIALILNVPMRFFERHLWPKAKKKAAVNARRPVAFLLSLIVILGILTGVILLVIPELLNAVKIVIQNALEIIRYFQANPNLENLPLGNILVKIDWAQIGATAEKWLREQSGNIVGGAMDTIMAIVGGVVDAVFAIIFSIYILFSKETLKRNAKRLVNAWIPQKMGDKIIHASSVANEVFRNFISGQSIESMILGSLCALGMLALQLPYAPMIGALVCVCSLIPVVGAFIAGGIGAFMIFTESPVKALIFIIFLVALQQLEGNLIYPRVMGSKINLPAIWVLAAVTVGGTVGGPLGILLGIPLASTAYVLVREATQKREQKLGVASEPAEITSEPEETKE